MNTSALIQKIKANDQDFEWYPSTDEIINSIKEDLIETRDNNYVSILDVGAGDGRVLSALTEGKKYAIEKSEILVNAMGADIFVVGTDLFQQTLIDKRVDVILQSAIQ